MKNYCKILQFHTVPENIDKNRTLVMKKSILTESVNRNSITQISPRKNQYNIKFSIDASTAASFDGSITRMLIRIINCLGNHDRANASAQTGGSHKLRHISSFQVFHPSPMPSELLNLHHLALPQHFLRAELREKFVRHPLLDHPLFR